MGGLIAPPLGWLFLHPVCLVPAFAVLAKLRGRRAFLAGWLVGVALSASTYYWLVETVANFTNLPLPVGLGALAAFNLADGFFLALFGWGFAAVRRASGSLWPAGIAAWFTACEFLMPQLFPDFHGVAWYQLPSLFLVVSLTGIAGPTFLVVLTNATVLAALERARGRAPLRPAAIGAALLCGLLLASALWSAARLERIAAAESGAETLRVALVQPNWDVHQSRALRKGAPSAVARELVALSADALAQHGPIDVFVWPERVLPSTAEDPRNALVLEFVRQSGAEVWTGAGPRERLLDGTRRSLNSAYRIHGDAAVDRRYDKTVLLPLGEYVPFEDTFPVLRRLEGPGRMTPGEELVVYDAGPARFAFLICYEAILAGYVRDAVRSEVNLLVNLTFDGWYGDTSEPHTHLMLSAIQAAQYGVPLVRGTTTGISAFIDARGVIRERSEVFTRDVLVRDVSLLHVPSAYAALGDWFAWSCALTSLALLLRSRRVGAR